MSDLSHDWFLLVKGTPGEKIHLATPGRYPSTLEVAYDALDPGLSLDWSGRFFGDPVVVERIIHTQAYDLSPEHVLPVAGGTSMGNFVACLAALRPGDEAVVQSPAWTQVANVCGRQGVEVKHWFLRPENRWRPDLDELEGLVGERTRLIYLCNPNNPTGMVLTGDEMCGIVGIADRHGAYILSDEIYRGLEWEGDQPCPSIVDHYDRAICSSSLTKALGVCGIRYGWIVTRDRELYQRCFDIYYDATLCNNVLSETVAARLLEPACYRELVEEGKAVGRRNLEHLARLVERAPALSMVQPQGAYCCMLRVENGEPSWDFCERLLKRKPIGVALVPGIVYNQFCEHHVRVGFGARPADFEAALAIVEEEL